MLLSNKVTGSVRGQYKHEIQPSERDRDFVELKGSTNLGYSDATSRLWIRSSVDFKILHAKFQILGRKAQPGGITFTCLDKNVPFDTIDHLTFNWMYRFLVLSRIFKAARPRFNVISGIEDYINIIRNLKIILKYCFGT